MAFDWTHYLYLARELCGHSSATPSNDDARRRAAVSRAYYAVFCSARNRLLTDGETLPADGSAHWRVRERYALSTDLRRARIGANLLRLHGLRKDADYQDSLGNLPGMTVVALGHATQAIADLDAL